MTINRRAFLKRSATGAALIAAGPGVFKKSAYAINPTRYQPTSDVSFVGSSADGTRRQMIADVLEPWRDTVAAGIQGKTVLIKVNMVYWLKQMRDPTLPLTHVDAVRGCLDFLRSISADVPVIIGDSTASPTALGNITTMFEGAGYNELLTEFTGVTLADLNTWPAEIKPIWTPALTTLQSTGVPIISAFFDENYYIISICRPKTHNNMVFTAVNKNILMGAPLNSLPEDQTTPQSVPSDTTAVDTTAVDTTLIDTTVVDTTGGDPDPDKLQVVPKQFMHGGNGWYSGQNPGEIQTLSYNLYQLANLMYPTGHPQLAILDAWEGMEGEGPVSGTSIMQYCAVAGIDPLAVDRIAAKLMGFSDTPTEPMNKETPSYTDNRALVWISNAGFGNYDLAKINFILGSLSEVETYVKSYKLPKNYTGTPSYETEWTGGPPILILDRVAVDGSRFLDPKPYLVPQIRKKVSTSTVSIDFTLPVSFRISMSIYNLRGAEIRRLGNEHLNPGQYSLIWDGRDARGKRVPSGKYIIRLDYGTGMLNDHITLLR